MKQPILSIIILNYNSGNYLSKCLTSLDKSITKYPFEVIVVDNNSTDKSADIDKKQFNLDLKIIVNNRNLGFSAGNNIGIKKTNPKTKYNLFLNPDTIVSSDTIDKSIDYLEKNLSTSALTCQIILKKTNQVQPECHRGFPTPWRSFCYFSGLTKLFPKSKLFSGYFLGHLDLNTTHPIEACVGAFILIRRTVGEKIYWWNEKYFFYGEDLDLCYKLYQKNYQLIYYPFCKIIHFQGISSGIKNSSNKLSQASLSTKIKSAKASTEAMRIFYQENYFHQYSQLTKFLVNLGIDLLEKVRLFKIKYSL